MKSNQKNTKTKLWMRLDNMANIFPAIELFSPAPIYKVAVNLDRDIDKDILRRAVEECLVRFPYFKVRLRRGLFWAYLEQNSKPIVVIEDSKYPCVGIDYKKNNYYLFKVKYYEQTIALEIFHALTDGGGAMVFLKTIAARYLSLTGTPIKPDKSAGIYDINEVPEKGEFKDSFPNYYNKKIKSLGILSPAYHYRGTFLKQDISTVIKAYTDGREFSALSKKYNLSVTEFLTAVYIYALMKTQEKTKDRKPIRISVPVNLRNIFPSITMRNFTYFVICEIRTVNGEYTFDEIAAQVYYTMRKGLLTKNLVEGFSGNVSSEKNIFVRILPLRFKLVMLSIIYSKRGENQYSGSMSNLGVIKLPEDMNPHIKGFYCNLSPNNINTTNCGAVCCNNELVITFTRTIKESEIEKEFFTFLVKQGLKIKIESNCCD